MTTAVQPLALDIRLPWAEDEAQEKAFQRWLKRILIPVLVMMLVIPWLPVFDLSYEAQREPAVVTEVMLEPLEEPLPPPTPEPVELAQPVTAKPVIEEEPQQARAQPKVAKKKGPAIKQDGENALADSQGLNALSNQLTALRGTLNLASLQNRNVSSSTQGEAKQSNREFLGKDGAVKRSDGITVDDSMLSGDPAGLAEYNSTKIAGVGSADLPISTLATHRSNKKGQRDMESIRRTLERTKSSVDAIFQKALVDNPELGGKFTFKLVIEPDGSISNLQLLGSELGVATLESEILRKIRALNFGAREVSPAIVEYDFLFFPS
ncbi:AgmX/PglI C-terminal domain-containing protein [Teredinibacter turnerae]|uniref:AgmX/PglI C-terminal domain-containing protein n=1 Tax=Teredinibacter turnerae TaxID=2426 RepID=UPI0003819885|nr:AgmX/PglI C-terminal domain-containing protein [Teredinibacter turnerae]